MQMNVLNFFFYVLNYLFFNIFSIFNKKIKLFEFLNLLLLINKKNSNDQRTENMIATIKIKKNIFYLSLKLKKIIT